MIIIYDNRNNHCNNRIYYKYVYIESMKNDPKQTLKYVSQRLS